MTDVLAAIGFLVGLWLWSIVLGAVIQLWFNR